MNVNLKYKNSVFSLLFNDPDILRELYCAIEGVVLPPDVPISINTLSNALIKGKVNDISFIIDNKLIVLIEHQSTINENMPLRLFKYIENVYDVIIDSKKLYKEKLVRIPRPEFIVLYNGEKQYPERKELKLSDAFLNIEGLTLEEKGNKSPILICETTIPHRISLELVVQVYNINHGHNLEILQKCETLNNYSVFICKIREYQKTGLALEKSIEAAVKYCIGNNILKDFLKNHGSEVINMSFLEYNFDDHMAVIREEAIEEGLEKGREEIARNALRKGYSFEEVTSITGLDLEILKNIQDRQN